MNREYLDEYDVEYIIVDKRGVTQAHCSGSRREALDLADEHDEDVPGRAPHKVYHVEITKVYTEINR